MTDEEWEELEMKAISTIRLCLAPEVKYNFLNETSVVDLWKKLENTYMSKSLTNRLFLKKELYQLKMNDGGDIRDHLNHFAKLITQLSSIGVKIEDEDKALLLLSSLPQSYENLLLTFLVGKETIKVDDVTAILLENEKFKNSNVQSEGGIYVARYNRGKSMSRDTSSNNDISRSSYGPKFDYGDKECYYCHEMGHIKYFCKKLKADMEEFEKSKKKETCENVTAIVQESSSYENELLMVEEGINTSSECWLLDSACSNHMCFKKEWFDTYETCENEVVKAANGDCLKVFGKGTVKVKMHNGIVRTLGNVRHVPTLGRNLISLGRLDTLGYGYSSHGGVMEISRGSLVIMKGKKTSNNLYEMLGETIITKDSHGNYEDRS